LTDSKKGFGPAFQSAISILFRSEYALISLTIFGYLVWSYRSGITWVDLTALIFFAILPDLAPFVPIGLYSSKGLEKGAWPSWGSALYNTFHTILLWALVFAISWVVLKSLYLPLFGWLLHITLDRSAGSTLRASK